MDENGKDKTLSKEKLEYEKYFSYSFDHQSKLDLRKNISHKILFYHSKITELSK